MDTTGKDAQPVSEGAVVTFPKAPWHLWVVGAVSLLWNCFGALHYTMSQLRHPAYLKAVTKDMGISPEQMAAFIDSFPLWMHAFWALAVWGALIGSILLLARSRFAVWAFGLSLAGLAVTQLYQAMTPAPAWAEQAAIMTLAIWIIAIGLLVYAVAMRRRGVLR